MGWNPYGESSSTPAQNSWQPYGGGEQSVPPATPQQQPLAASASMQSAEWMAPPATNPAEFAGNLATDFGNTLNGLKTVASGAAQRWSETITPKMLWQPDQESMAQMFQDNPINAITPYPPLRNGDLEAAAQMGQGLIDHYNNRYVKPIMQGDPGKISEEFLSEPFTTTTDLLPLAGPLKGVGNAIKNSPLFANGAKLAGTISQSVPLIDTAVNNIQAAKQISQTFRNANNQYLDEAARVANPVREAYDKIPEQYRNEVIQAGEMRDLAAYNRLKDVPEVREFWRLASHYGDQVANMLIQGGGFSAEEHLAAKYGPLLKNIHGVSNDVPASKAFESYLHTPQGQQELRALQAKMEAQGETPTYFGLVKPKEVAQAAKYRANLFGEQRARVTPHDPNRQAAQAAVNNTRPQAFMRRTIGLREAHHEINAYKTWETRVLQGLRFLRLRDAFAEMISDPRLAQGGQDVNIHQFFGNLTQAAGMTPEGIQHFTRGLPETARLPKLAAEMMQAYLAEPQGSQILGAGNTLFKTLTLGLDAFWAVNQSLQDAMMGFTAMWRSPRDVAASWIAHQMVFRKHPITKRIPASWLGGVTQEAEASGLMGHLSRIAPPLFWYMDKVFKGADLSQKYWRSVIGIYSLMRSIEQVDPKLRVPLAKAFEIMTREDQLVTAFDNPEAVAKASAEINKWMGQYDSLTAQLWSGPRAVLPFALWYRHSATFSAAAALETPAKSAVVNNLARQAPAMLQGDELTDKEKERGAVSVRPEGYSLRGPNGGYLTRTAGGFTPNTQFPELLTVAGNWMTNEPKQVEGVAVSPVLTWLVGTFIHRNISTGMEFNDPSKIRMDGKQFDPVTNEEVKPVPNPVSMAARAWFPRQEAAVRASAAYPYKPSDMTTPFDPATQKSSQNPEGIKAFSPEQQAAFTFLKSTPTEQRIDAETEDKFQAKTIRKLMRAAARQGFRLKGRAELP